MPCRAPNKDLTEGRNLHTLIDCSVFFGLGKQDSCSLSLKKTAFNERLKACTQCRLHPSVSSGFCSAGESQLVISELGVSVTHTRPLLLLCTNPAAAAAPAAASAVCCSQVLPQAPRASAAAGQVGQRRPRALHPHTPQAAVRRTGAVRAGFGGVFGVVGLGRGGGKQQCGAQVRSGLGEGSVGLCVCGGGGASSSAAHRCGQGGGAVGLVCCPCCCCCLCVSQFSLKLCAP